VILAGGQGERLFPLTVSRPKPAVSFGGMFRIIDFTLSNCMHSKLKRVSVLTQYRHEQLHLHIRQGWSDFWNRSQHERSENNFDRAQPSRDEKDPLALIWIMIATATP
jgi:ADP-glucose pyrophosphorylase